MAGSRLNYNPFPKPNHAMALSSVGFSGHGIIDRSRLQQACSDPGTRPDGDPHRRRSAAIPDGTIAGGKAEAQEL